MDLALAQALRPLFSEMKTKDEATDNKSQNNEPEQISALELFQNFFPLAASFIFFSKRWEDTRYLILYMKINVLANLFRILYHFRRHHYFTATCVVINQLIFIIVFSPISF